MNLKDEVIKVAKEVYTTLGAGYDESVYHRSFEVEMRLRELNYVSEKPVEVIYKEYSVGYLFADIFIWRGKEKVLIEFKAGSASFIPKVAKGMDKVKEIKQVDNYFRMLNLPKETTVLLINFPFPATTEPDIIEVH